MKPRNIPQQDTNDPDVVAKENAIIGQVFDGPLGEQALNILRQYFYDRPMYTPKEPNQPYQTIYKNGQRDVVGWIMSAIDAYHHPEDEEKKEVKS